jgi:hypothetical protein
MTSSFKNLTINDTGYLQLPSGTSAQRSNYIVQTFTTTGTTSWICPTDVATVEVLVVAGGAGASGDYGGGGGAGGVIYNSAFSVTPGNSYTVTVGGGGPGTSGATNLATNGSNSVFGSLTAIGGGRGGAEGNHPGTSGGSGGGTSYSGTSIGTGTSGQGNAGGYGNIGSPNYPAGGGGGAGSSGGNAVAGSPAQGGAGGEGIPYSISGTLTYYAGGGGGGSETTGKGGPGGQGGGAGATAQSVGGAANTGSNGTANTGGGGGGGAGDNGIGGAGGSGIVVLRYKQVKTFTSAGSTTWTVPSGVTNVEVLVVAGGGGGGGNATGGQTPQGGGGAGGLVYNPYFTVTPGAVLNVTVGAGGAGGTTGSNAGASGGNSLFGTSTNLITNGNLTSNTTGWTDPASGSEGTFVAGGSGVTITATNSSDPPPCIYQAITCTIGSTYQVAATRVSGTASIVVNVANGINVNGGVGATNVLYFTTTATGTLANTFVATQTTHYIFLRINENTTNAVVMTGISVYDVTNTILAIGGGSTSGQIGTMGGSGGGSRSGTADSRAFSTGQGNLGGAALGGANSAGGGGGAGSAGTIGGAGQTVGGNGGAGIASNITGVTRYYAGGGGGGGYYNAGGGGGVGGGGDGGGGSSGTTPGSNATANTGGGGGGAGSVNGGSGGAGGSGIVIVSYNSVNSTLTQRPGMIRNNSTSTYTRNTIDSFKHIQSSGSAGLSWSAPDGLVCLLDAGNTQSYPGTGSTWFDISGNNRHFSINPGYAVWNSAAQQSYFNLDGSSSIVSANTSAATAGTVTPFVGPPSNKMGFETSQEHTVISIVRVTASSNNFFYSFALTPATGAGEYSSRWTSHLYYGGGNLYYDYPGCCNNVARMYITMDASWVGNTKIATWRCRRPTYPNRQFWRNNIAEADSGNVNTGLAIWNRPEPATLGAAYNGRIYYFAFYNRALTDAELATQWTYLTARFGIT